MNDINPAIAGYVAITDYLEPNTGKDVSDAIQKAIDENPMRTLYFPDGEYILAKPISTSGKPENAVSFLLSNFAVLKAADNWDHEEAMVRLGGAEAYNTIYRNGSNYSFVGGIIDGNMVANGICIESGRETCIRNVSIKHTFVGLHIKRGANGGSSDADIETVNIVGNNKKNSVGVIVEGHDNTLTNMRIAAVQTGVFVRSSTNCFRNIHPLFIYGYEYLGEDDINFADSVAFLEEKGNNWYDFCYSDQMATGFKLFDGSRAVLTSCFVMWYTAKGDKEVAFECNGTFKASIMNPRVHFRADTQGQRALLKGVTDNGKGFLQDPIFNEELCDDKTYVDYVKGEIHW